MQIQYFFAAVATVIIFVIVAIVISPMPHSMTTHITDIQKQSYFLPLAEYAL
jgi:hypothetical protein